MTYRELPESHELPPPVVTHDLPTRVWHWVAVFSMFALIVSGYFIGAAPPSVSGDTSELYTMGKIRFVHLVAGQIFTIALLGRFYWAICGGEYARQMFLPDFWMKSWTDGFVTQLKWSFLLMPRAPRYLGLNPLGATAVFFLFVIPSILTILTGYAMLAEVAGHDSWEYHVFGWMMTIFPNTLDLHLIHRLCMWVMVCFIIIHIYITVRDDIFARQTLISSMLSGERVFRH